MKVNGHHLRCLPVLASQNLRKETRVRLVWPTGVEGKTLKTQSLTAICEEPPADRRSAYCDLRFAAGQTLPRIPSGTVVVDAESGAALGMITDPSQPTRFATTRFFGELCAEVGLAPDRDAAQGKKPRDKNMVRVEGGAVVYDNSTFVSQYGTAITCTPDFYCDTYLVTMSDWAEFLKVRPDRPWPEGWGGENKNNPPIKYPKLPVTGATGGDMQDYAALHNKRMITPVEWISAAQTTGLDWLDREEQRFEETKSAIQQNQKDYQKGIADRVGATAVTGEILETINQNKALALSQATGRPLGSSAVPNSRIPTVSLLDLTTNYAQSLTQLLLHNAALVGKLPGQPHDIGSFGDDKSDWGVYDVTMNVPEACLSWGTNYLLAPKLSPAGQDPFITQVYSVFSTMGTDPNTGVPRETISPDIRGTLAGIMVSDPRLWAGVWQSQFGGLYQDQPLTDARVSSGFFICRIDARCNAGFRCAR